MSFRMAAELQN